jgi:hypothetical protein
VTPEVAVREIETGNIHAGPDHVLHDFPRRGSRPDGANDLCLVSWQTHGLLRADLIRPGALSILTSHCEPEGHGNLLLLRLADFFDKVHRAAEPARMKPSPSLDLTSKVMFCADLRS